MIEIDTKLVLTKAGGHVGMSFSVDFRVDAQGDVGAKVSIFGQHSQLFKLLQRLNIDAE